MRIQRVGMVIGLILFLFVATFLPAEAKSGSNKVLIVPAGETVDNFFSIGHNASIEGTVRNLVFVVGGDLHLSSTAKVKELIIVIDGSVIQDSGTHVTENIFSFAWNKSVTDAFLFGGALLLSGWVIKLLLALFLILFATLGAYVTPSSIDKHGLFGSWKLWLTGVIAGLWLLILIVILSITIVGIPFALILMIIPLVSCLIVSGSLSRELGQRLLPEKQGGWESTVLGAIILSGLMGLPLIGFLLIFGLTILSLGHMVLWITDKWKGRKVLTS